MKKIIRSNQFKRDYKKLVKQGKNIGLLKTTIKLLVNNKDLSKKMLDHKLNGNWKGNRECHIQPDWLLIYKTTPTKLELVRTGSHSDLFSM